ncbi:MAG: galactokinase [Caldilineae bacterium]|nr:MAG: galactokinase [Caldilineae bacterium]
MADRLAFLEDIYGEAASAHESRYRAALDAFVQAYGPGPVHIFRAPGRVNLIGEHTDYNQGYVMPVALDRDVLFLARPRPDALIRLVNVEDGFPPRSFTISPRIPSGQRGDWSNYVRGPAQELARRLPAITGMDCLVNGAPPLGVPRGAGLSSSSALTVAAAVALAHFAGWAWQGNEMARLCAEAEWYVGTRGGVMDHFIALLAQRGHALFLDCRPDAAGRLHYEPIPLPGGFRLLVVNSGVHHANVRGEFNQRVAACRAGVALLRRHWPGIHALRDVEGVDWAALEPHLPEAVTLAALMAQGLDLGDLPNVPPDAPLRVRACCRHVWTENHRVRQAVAAMKAGDVDRLAHLLDEAHASARDDYRISTPELDALVEAAREVPGVRGARLTGAGWGGCVISLVPAQQVQRFETHVQERYRTVTGRQAEIFPCQAGPGAGLAGVVRDS